VAKLAHPYPTDQMQRDWGRENELNPILGFSGDGHPRTSPRSLHSIGQTRCVTHEWRGLEEIKFMVHKIHEVKPYNAMIQIPFSSIVCKLCLCTIPAVGWGCSNKYPCYSPSLDNALIGMYHLLIFAQWHSPW
jgi:hypothetical protein